MAKHTSQSVLSYFPVTAPFKEQLERAFGAIDGYHPVGKIRNEGLRGLWSHMRNLRGSRLIIAVEGDNSRPLVGPLRLLAAATRVKQIVVFWPDSTHAPMPWWQILPILWSCGAEQVVARRALRRVQRQARQPSAPRDPAPKVAPPRRHAIFLDANLSFGLSAGGSLGHIKGVIDGLIARNYSIDYVSTKPMPTETDGAVHVKIPAPRLLAFPAELNYYAFHRSADQVSAEAARSRPVDFVYQRMSLHNISGVGLSREAGVPLVVEYNGSEAWTAANWGQKLTLHDDAVAAERYVVKAADLLVTVSAPLAQELEDLGIPRDRIVMYPNCIDPRIFDPARFDSARRAALRDRLGIAADARVATFIGTFGMWHGVDFLARAIRRLIDEDPGFVARNKLHFLLVGDGLRMPEVRAAIEAPPYRQFVTLPGLVPQAEAPEYLAISDMFLSPHMPNKDGSIFFGSPTKLFEYMAMERPIVAADLDQIGTILRGEFHGRTSAPPLARLFPPGDETAMLEALRQVVAEPEESQAMAERARDHVLENFTWDHHVGHILDRMDTLGLLTEEDAGNGVQGNG
ncbi:hypothetical protein U879_03515 [Defluviimonas sp. 20V17]|uniref:Glycosyltransferase involved in cell wall bisynthesis n=1 Tax=Allgaiera indica TaxID=765699 RepID=A0AAN4UTL5_9RHOB|nr:glycosyltransferase [Allgaiera indica]KDB05076.1 hypothetical protein U879_03515 [Defluviimonas sp. 20V17]GHE04532.1 hypothetical protein GCM10008024_32040 [Allgaiera indica]SDX57386.1 Glycosyltransferase involved in cell wall bisynthesis [Allgaiera indica]